MSEFVYVTYIRTTPEKLWEALTQPETMRQYLFGAAILADWKKGGAWKMAHGDGRVSDSGEVLEAEKPKRIVLKWRSEWTEELAAEGYSRCTMDIEPKGETVMLKITHEIERDNSKLIQSVSGGWPKILSGLKSLLETGQALSTDVKTAA